MKCPSCGGKAELTVNSVGGGSAYCLDACGYEEKYPARTYAPPPKEKKAPKPPKQKKKRRRDDDRT